MFCSFFVCFFYQTLPGSNQDVALFDISSFPTPAPTQSASAASASFPHPHGSALAATLPPARAHSFSLAAPVHAAPPVPPPQVFSSPGLSHTTSASLNEILQELDLLDLGSSTACVITCSFG